MITETDRIVASILAISDGPLPHQSERGGWTPEMIEFNRKVLIALAKSIRSGMYRMLSDDEVKRLIAEGGV